MDINIMHGNGSFRMEISGDIDDSTRKMKYISCDHPLC